MRAKRPLALTMIVFVSLSAVASRAADDTAVPRASPNAAPPNTAPAAAAPKDGVPPVVVDRAGQVRAAVIDFGGFLGVGSRKIVVDWNALRFWRIGNKSDSISLELTKEQVRAAPEYKEDAPIVVLGASGSLQPLQYGP